MHLFIVFILDDVVQCFNCDSCTCREEHVQLGHEESADIESSSKKSSKLEAQRRLLEKHLDDMYPWRQKKPTSTGMSFIQHTAFNVGVTTEKASIHRDSPPGPLLSVGIRDLEYSMEPRNFSRGPSKLLSSTAPVVGAAPLDSAGEVDAPVDSDNSTQVSSTNDSAIPTTTAWSAITTEEETKVQTFYDELVSVLPVLFIVIDTVWCNYSSFL